MHKLLAVVTLLASMTACTSDSIVGSSTVAGAYSLRTVNGAALPYTTSGSGTNKTEVVDDTFTLYGGGTYARTSHTRTTVNGTATTSTVNDTGPYALLGTSISLNSNNDGSQTIAIYTANTMTVVRSGVTSVYRK
jgi:hypothetical protein